MRSQCSHVYEVIGMVPGLCVCVGGRGALKTMRMSIKRKKLVGMEVRLKPRPGGHLPNWVITTGTPHATVTLLTADTPAPLQEKPSVLKLAFPAGFLEVGWPGATSPAGSAWLLHKE